MKDAFEREILFHTDTPLPTKAQVKENTLSKIISAFREPAFLVTDDGSVILANKAARDAFSTPPEWLASVSKNDKSPLIQRLARTCRVTVDQHYLWLVLPNSPHSALDSEGKQPGFLTCLPPSLARVANLLILGLSDKEIAECTSLTLASVRTYTRRIYQKSDVNGRQELLAKVLAERLNGLP